MSDTKNIKLADLLLDEENPRLPTTVGRQQSQMAQYIVLRPFAFPSRPTQRRRQIEQVGRKGIAATGR